MTSPSPAERPLQDDALRIIFGADSEEIAKHIDTEGDEPSLNDLLLIALVYYFPAAHPPLDALATVATALGHTAELWAEMEYLRIQAVYLDINIGTCYITFKEALSGVYINRLPVCAEATKALLLALLFSQTIRGIAHAGLASASAEAARDE